MNINKLGENMYINHKEIAKGHKEFEKREGREAMYKVATFLVKHFWGHPPNVADGLGVLLLTWNQAFYRYGSFNFTTLEKCIKDNLSVIKKFRQRNIRGLVKTDDQEMKDLFIKFLDALQIATGKMKSRKSPVAVAKTLHLLAPNFFPLWDDKIARAYGCYYSENPADKYIEFCYITKSMADGYINHSRKTIVKIIDEYNYAKYTKKWI